MPDQSLQNDPAAEQPKSAQQTGNPAEVAGNTPSEAQPSALAANVTEASRGEKQQADQTINKDPQIGEQPRDGAPRAASGGGTQDYSELNLEELREELGSRNLSKSGNKPDLIKRLEQHDASGGGGDVDLAGGSSANLGAETTDAEPSEDVVRAEVDPQQVENGGIQRTQVGQQHAEVLQGLSNERREQQLAAAKQNQQQD